MRRPLHTTMILAVMGALTDLGIGRESEHIPNETEEERLRRLEELDRQMYEREARQRQERLERLQTQMADSVSEVPHRVKDAVQQELRKAREDRTPSRQMRRKLSRQLSK